MSAYAGLKEEYKGIFLDEAQVQIQEWEEALLSLEKAPADRELINRIFRAIHTLKGSSGFVGMAPLQKLAHEIETGLQAVRDGQAALCPEMVQILFEGLDASRKLVDAFASGAPFVDAVESIRAKLDGISSAGIPLIDSAGAPIAAQRESIEKNLFQIGIQVDAPSTERYLRSLLVHSRLEDLGTVVMVTPSLEDLRMRGEEFAYVVVLETKKAEEQVMKALLLDQVKVVQIKSVKRSASESQPPDVDSIAAQGKSSDELYARVARSDNMVRVPASKLDAMLNLVGELVIQNAGFISIAGELKTIFGRSPLITKLEEKSEQLARVARELQDAVMKVRMLPVATVFNRFQRVVRDLSRNRGKEVRLDIYGEETEIDKKVIDRMGEPLVHLVRNAVDHGIEGPDDRRAAGKNPTGFVRLGAYQEGDRICVEISDDGRGLDRERIITKGIEKGLITSKDAQGMSNEAAFHLIFLPGFSTAEQVTDISGRGVGLDVVKRFVEEMDGAVQVRSSIGKGTTVKITLPLTMAIIRTILVQTSTCYFAIPLSSVREIIKVDPRTCRSLHKETVVQLRDEILSLVPLRELLRIGGNGGSSGEEAQEAQSVVVVDYEGHRIGVIVDRLLGITEIVIKSLSRHYREIEGLVGASILGNGAIALILDVEAIMSAHYRQADIRKSARIERQSVATGDVSEAGLVKPESSAIEEPPAIADAPPEAAGISEPAPATEQAPPWSLDEKQRETLNEIFATSAMQASSAMSTLMRRTVQVSFPELKLVRIAEVSGALGGDESAVVRVYVEFTGEVVGGNLIVLPIGQALRFCDILFERAAGKTVDIDQEDLSAIAEVGNILSASFINAIANQCGCTLHPQVPDVRIDMCLSTIDSVLSRFNRPGDEILLTEAQLFYGDSDQTLCHMLLFLEIDSMARVQQVLSADGMRKAGLPA